MYKSEDRTIKQLEPAAKQPEQSSKAVEQPKPEASKQPSVSQSNNPTVTTNQSTESEPVLIHDRHFDSNSIALTQQSRPNVVKSAPSTLQVGKHHATFSHACYREGYWDQKEDKYVKGKMLMYGVNDKLQRDYHDIYFSQLHPDWGVSHEYVAGHFPPRNVPVLEGNTFFYTLFEDNIAQFYQELACHVPVMLTQEYRDSVGYSQHWWNHFFAPHITFAEAHRPQTNAKWCAKQMKWVLESAQEYQPNMPINILDERQLAPRKKAIKDSSEPMMCFQNVTLYQSSSCNGVTGPYPNGTDATYAHIKQHIFSQLGLTPKRECARKMVIYDRYDAPRRRLMNGADMKKFFEEKLRARPHTEQVQVLHVQDLPKQVLDQARFFNDADIVIQPHSASNYNALFMHDGAAHMEIGQHGTWFGTGIAPYINTGLHYYKWDWGYELLDYDPKWDNQEFLGERSFRASRDLMEALWDSLQHRFCNSTSG